MVGQRLAANRRRSGYVHTRSNTRLHNACYIELLFFLFYVFISGSPEMFEFDRNYNCGQNSARAIGRFLLDTGPTGNKESTPHADFSRAHVQ